MILKFCICKDDPRKVDKSLTEVHSVNNVAIYQACSIMAPEFVVDYREDLLACNYVVTGIGVSQSGRAYFIKEHVVLPGGRLVIRCAIDVLNTWKSHIWECNADIIRQEKEAHKSKTSRFIFDQYMCGKTSTRFDHVPFSLDPFFVPDTTIHGQKYTYLITVVGGEHVAPPTPPENRGDSND